MIRSATIAGIAVLVFALASPALAVFDPVPEIDPGAGMSALSLLVGGVLVLLGRNRTS